MTKLKLRFMYIVLKYIEINLNDNYYKLTGKIYDLQKDIKDKLKEE